MLEYDSQYQIREREGSDLSILSCENISLAYDRNVVVSDLTFSIERGAYLCVVGENGSGKSTLIKALLGLIAPVSGRIILGDGLTQSDLSYLPQQSAVKKDFPASVREVVLSGRLSHKKWLSFYNAKDRELAKESMDRLAISHLADSSFKELSGGQQQRVLLARALCSGSELLFIDEPTTGLDPLVTVDFYRLIKEVSSSGKTVIMVTHDVTAAVEDATHILHIHNKPVFFGTKEEYIVSEAKRGYFGKL